MNERHLRWQIPHLSRDFEMLVFGDGGGIPLVLFPTSFGRFYQNKDFGVIEACSHFVESGKGTIYCPDAIDLDSFYNKAIHPADRMRTHNAFENVIIHDVFDIARRECPAARVAVCGASLGAYHAGNIAFRHPDLISDFISMSGAFDISDFFGGYFDDVYFNSPTTTSRISPIRGNLTIWGIILGTGEWDNTRNESLRLSTLLNEKGVNHWLDDRRWCGHDWNYWRDMLPHYLSVL